MTAYTSIRRPGIVYYDLMPPDVVVQLLATDTALDKLGARQISASEAEEIPSRRQVVVRNPNDPTDGKRVLLIGTTSTGRVLTLVLERTVEPTTWLIVTGWTSTKAERKLLDRRR